MNTVKYAGRIIAGAYYDYQEVRISSMNRIRDIIRKISEGIEFDAVEVKKEKKYDKKYQDKNLMMTLDKMIAEKKMSDEDAEYLKKTLALMEKSSKLENSYKNLMMTYISEEKIWKGFLAKVKGLGPVLSSNLIKNFGDCGRFQTVSSLWKYCGYHVVGGASVKREKGKKLGFNLKMRTLCWKIADSLIKQNSPIYRDIYDNEKARQLARKDKNKPKNKMHAHLRALRVMIKVFLQHYYSASKELTGQKAEKPYVIEKLKHRDFIPWTAIIEEYDQRKGLK